MPTIFEVFMAQNILKWLKNLVFGSSVGSKKIQPRGNPGNDITEILLKVVLNTITLTPVKSTGAKHVENYKIY